MHFCSFERLKDVITEDDPISHADSHHNLVDELDLADIRSPNYSCYEDNDYERILNATIRAGNL